MTEEQETAIGGDQPLIPLRLRLLDVHVAMGNMRVVVVGNVSGLWVSIKGARRRVRVTETVAKSKRIPEAIRGIEKARQACRHAV